jgi:hypothetical protein
MVGKSATKSKYFYSETAHVLLNGQLSVHRALIGLPNFARLS